MARFLSIIFHPLLLPTYLFAIILYVLPESAVTFPREQRWVLLAGIGLVTFLIPGLGTYVLVRAGVVQSVMLQDREQRRLPLLLTAVCYAAVTYIFRNQNNLGELFYLTMLVITLSVFVTYMVSLFWKISAHSMGMGGALGLLILLNTLLPENPLSYLIALFVLLSGAVMSARLALNEHDPAQVYTGFLTGLAIGSSMLLILLLRA
ncbi:MAG TPA: hypothetical protein VK927_01305 [Adhaeribacter sp.]|nr:hypothetical protein [Adhaeribacter sp.]